MKKQRRGLNRYVLQDGRKSKNKPMTAFFFNSRSSTSMTLKEWDDVILLAIVVLTVVAHARRTDVVEMPWHCKVRRPYAVRTQYILHDTPMIKIIRHIIASDTLWIRKARPDNAS